MAHMFGGVSWKKARQATATPAPVQEQEVVGTTATVESTLAPALLGSVVALYAVTFAILSVMQHASFQTNAFDLGNMDQAVWNTLHGRFLEFTNWEGGNTRLAVHVEPILFLVAPFYALYSGPETLLVLQSMVLALGALPAFWLARRVLDNVFAAAVCGFTYLLAPALEIANLADFHAVAFSSTLLLFAFYYAYQRNNVGFFIAAVLAMATKEHVPFTIFLMGLYIVFVQRRLIVGYAASGIALAWAAIAFGVVLPHFNPEGVSPYLSRYDQLGRDPLDMLTNVLSDPGAAIGLVLEPAKLDYVQSVFSPTLYLALLSPATVVMALPDLAINLLSNFPEMFAGRAHYGAVLVPVVTISTILGLANARRLLERVHPLSAQWGVGVLAVLVLGSSLMSFWQQVFLPLTDHLPETTKRMDAAHELKALIPPDAAVAASTTLNPHVSQRQQVFLFPDIEQAEYIFLDVTASPYPIDAANQWWRVQKLLNSGDWGVVAARNGYLLLQRGAPASALPEEFYTFVRGDPSTVTVPLSLMFGDAVELAGYDLVPGEQLHGTVPHAKMTLFFKTHRWLPQDFLISVSVVGDGNQEIYHERYQPTTLWVPPTKWVPGELMQVQLLWLPLARADHAEVRVALVGTQEPYAPLPSLLPEAEVAQQPLRNDGTAVRIVELRRGF